MELPSTQTGGSKRPPGSSMAKPNPHTEAPSAPEPPKAVKVHNIHTQSLLWIHKFIYLILKKMCLKSSVLKRVEKKKILY